MQPWVIDRGVHPAQPVSESRGVASSHLPLGGGNARVEGQKHIFRLTRSYLVFDLASVRINYCLPCVVPLNETTPVR